MKAKLLKIIRRKFTIVQYWDNEIKESVIMSKNNKTRFVNYHQGRHHFKDFYESICWQLWNRFDYKDLWQKRVQGRNQRKLKNEFEFRRTKAVYFDDTNKLLNKMTNVIKTNNLNA